MSASRDYLRAAGNLPVFTESKSSSLMLTLLALFLNGLARGQVLCNSYRGKQQYTGRISALPNVAT